MDFISLSLEPSKDAGRWFECCELSLQKPDNRFLRDGVGVGVCRGVG